MQALQKPKNKKKFLLIAVATLLISGAAAAYWIIARPFQQAAVTSIPDRPANHIDYGPPSEAEQKAAQQQKEEIVKQNEDQGVTPQDSGITISIVRADQAAPGQPLNIRADVGGTQSGTCEVNLSKAAQPTINKSFSVIFEATSSRCQATDIAISEFSEGGQWKLSVVAKNNKGQSKPAEQIVDIKK